MVLCIGDVHGEFDKYLSIIEKADCSLQLGDMGIGFPVREEYKIEKKYNYEGKNYSPILGREHLFFRGNHDDPDLCRQHPNYLGDYGYDKNSGIFYVAGGFSVDKIYRTAGITWWQYEELTYKQSLEALELYGKIKPSIIASHECPTEVKLYAMTNMFKKDIISNTESLLQNMLEIHRPDIWIFGHHHIKKEIKIKNTLFVCLGDLKNDKIENCVYKIPDIKW
jgi:hypothetical protein